VTAVALIMLWSWDAFWVVLGLWMLRGSLNRMGAGIGWWFYRLAMRPPNRLVYDESYMFIPLDYTWTHRP
jgi:hypothetical protein